MTYIILLKDGGHQELNDIASIQSQEGNLMFFDKEKELVAIVSHTEYTFIKRID